MRCAVQRPTFPFDLFRPKTFKFGSRSSDLMQPPTQLAGDPDTGYSDREDARASALPLLHRPISIRENLHILPSRAN